MYLKSFCNLVLGISFASALSLRAQPSITSFTPTYGSSSDPNFITITGSGFYPGTLTVKFNGVVDPTAAATTADGTTIHARVPASAPFGAGRIFVQVNSSSTLSSQNFTVIGPGPYVDHFTPTMGGGGAMVTLIGGHFTGVTNVAFNGKNAPSINVQTDTQIIATTPAGVTSGPLLIRSPTGSYSTSTNATTTNFYVSPIITGFSPSSGRTGTNVVITGTNFLATSAITIGSIPVTTFTVLSNGAVQITIPPNAASGVFLLDAPAGAATTTSNFVVQPTIFGFTPASGPIGSSVTITGANFNVGTPVVRFNGVVASTPTGVTFSQLTTTVPSTTTGPITVTTSDGAATSSTLFYVPASITSFTPVNGPPGTLVKLTGINFSNASSVSFNGTPAANFYVTNNTIIGAVVPAGVSTGPISVTTPAGTTNSTGFFYASPAITSFLPTHGLPGTNVVLTGLNFLGATSVKFNGLNASFVPPTNNTTLVATVPNGATTGPITVAAPGGTNTTASNFVLDYNSDLSVTITDLPDPVIIGSNLVYTIFVSNNGPFDAPNVRLTNTLPATVTLSLSTTTQGTLAINGNVVIGSFGTILHGAQVTVTLKVVPQVVGSITNTATVTGDYADFVPGNNTISEVTTVLPLPFLSIARIPNQVKLSWPVALSNFSLQAASSLLGGNSWSNMTNVPIISGNSNVVTDPSTAAARFYRLKQ
jgi:hypothetical protein